MKALLFLNGKLPYYGLIKKFINKGTYIIAADGGANRLKRLGIKPDIIIGDMDSINKSVLKHYTAVKVKVEKIPEQETTDFEKCLMHCLRMKVKEVIVFGATSMRPDHSLNNFSIMKRYYKRISINLMTDEYDICMAARKIKFNYRQNEIISLLAMPEAKGIRTLGLKYPLDNEDLVFGKREGTLNKAVQNEIYISFKSGDLLLFKKHFL